MSEEALVAEPEESTPSTEDELQDEAVEVEESEESEASGEEPAEDDEPTKAQKRINALTYQRHEAERQASQLRAELDALKRQIQVQPTETGVAPNPLDFDDPAAFQKAQSEYIRNVAKAINEESRTAEVQQRTQADRDLARQQYSAKIAAHAAEDAEFVELIRSATFDLTDAMSEVLVSSEKPVELTRYLAEHAEEAVRISRMPPVQQAREMGRIEARLESLQPNRVSGAPPRMSKPKGNERVRVNPDKMSVSEWKAWREAQLAKQHK